jgi:hypothetical protein
MKENTQRILSWLYPAEKTARWVPARELALIVPATTQGGLQSILAFMQENKRILLERVDNQLTASITSHGMRALEAQLPAFLPERREWQGDWQAIFFLNAPKQDKHFRFLRRVLLGAHALPVSRGMFLYPGELPDRVTFELRQSYEGSVLAVKLKSWTFGDEQEIIGSAFQLSDLADSYSSVGKEIDSLLALDAPLIAFTDQAKLRFISVFDRLFSALHTDFGVQQIYFPQVETGVSLLFRLQKLSSQG